MSCFEEEGSWNLSFVGAGFLGIYHVGVTHCLRERAPRLLQGAGRVYGSSSGTLNALCIVMGESVDFCCKHLLDLVKQVEQLSLGIFHPAYVPAKHIREKMEATLPGNIHILASQRLGVSLTHWPDGQNVIVTDFASREELIQAVVCSVYIPFYCGMIPVEFRGERYWDGALSNALPFADCPHTITVSPFPGTVDICPQSTSASLHELNIFNCSFQISATNIAQGIMCLMPPKPEPQGGQSIWAPFTDKETEALRRVLWPSQVTQQGRRGAFVDTQVLADTCRQGYLDALRFLEQRGLTKEPVLWTLVSKEPPAPEDGTQDAGWDRGQEPGLSLKWAVPNVWVKDVPNFEKLSPEMEAALKKACMRDPSPWARFCRSRPGRALTYLLLPYTLPLEYAYFQSRRLVVWLPDVPADLWWMQSVLRGVALGLCSSTKEQLLGLARLLVPSPFQPEAVPPEDPTEKPRPTLAHQA